MRNTNAVHSPLLWLPIILLPAGNLLTLFFSPADFMPHTLLLSLIGAAAEELFFRRFLLKTILLPRIPPTSAILLTAVLFAAMHLLNLRNGTGLPLILPQMLCAFCFGIWAGAAVWQRQSVTLPLTAHILLNASALSEASAISTVVSFIVLLDGILIMKMMPKAPHRGDMSTAAGQCSELQTDQ